ncbi:MAG: Bifunctional protein HldE [Candidatus Moanabacter tarae]|uniref:Bifunctional protein HldE n=1 Tax=Candidatus Moanibacter tarae TaxID=2200854 RepID=A0A2Z4ADN1_9BACT|nr:MAG: Bifunctional protein HldE [Candidatus Moanabacter tarae]|tara:strand:- start:15470 stop:16474 length:1005 start_codon:yes stop_codon:yes gene_type:complete
MGNKVKTLLERINRLRLLVVGDVILDHYIWGETSRVSPEAPVPVVTVNRDTYGLGGAANVALNLNDLGCQVAILGIIGDDWAGERTRVLMEDAQIKCDGLIVSRNAPTILKTRVIAQQQQLCRLDRESPPQEYSIGLSFEGEKVAELVREADAVIFSDYGKGCITENLIETVQELASEKEAIVAYDPKPRRRIKFKGFGLMTPNRIESLELAGIETSIHADFPAAEVCRRIWEKYEPRLLAVTLASDGLLLSEEGEVTMAIPTYAREVFEVSGAGDTVIAALTAAMAAGAEIKDAAHLANTAAGIVVGKWGTSTATPEELLEYARLHGCAPSEN